MPRREQQTTTTEASWPAAKVEMWPMDRIRPYEKNPRSHPEPQIQLIAKSMRDDGVTAPILVDEDGVIIYGHGRRLAAMANQYARFPVIVARGWSEAQKRAVRIKDNSLASLSGWDDAFMRTEVTFLKDSDIDLSILGFNDSQLAKFLDSTPGRTEPDAAPDLPKVAIIKPGEIWTLGRHRLMCGDATKPADVARLAGDDLCAMTFTDPPFGVAYRDTGQQRPGKRYGNKPKFDAIENDDLNEEQLLEFLIAYMALQPITKTAAQYVFHANLHSHVFREAILASGKAVIREVCIWNKSRASFNFANYKWKHEPIFYAVPKKGKVVWYGDKTQTTMWDVPSESGAAYKHPTQKPVGLAAIAIKNSSKAGDYVYEPFAGSGSTLIACEMSGRSCIAMELSASYVEVVIQRWEAFTGLAARLGDRDYASIAAERKREKPAKTKGKSNAARLARKSVSIKAQGRARAHRPVAQSPVREEVPAA